MYRGKTVSDDDEDHSSEATMKFYAKIKPKFRRAFPLRGESNLRRPTTIATEKSAKDHANHLQSEMSSSSRKELIKQDHIMDIENVKNELNKVLHSRDEWREASTRFHRYFQCAKARLILAEKELRRRGLLNENMKLALTHAWTATECNTKNIQENLCDLLRSASTTLEELDKSAEEQEEVEKYMRSLTKKNGSDDDGNDDSDSNDTAMIFEEPEGAVIRDSISPIIPASLEAEQSTISGSILISTFANTSIDYEKDERIQRLELENSRMHDRLNLLRDRAQKSMLMEEQKNNAEQKYCLLEKNMEEILAEHQSQQSACAKKLFDFPEKTSQGRSTEIIKMSQDLNLNVETLQEQLRGSRFEIESSKKEIEALRRERDALLRKVDQITAINEDLKNSLYVEKERSSDLTRTAEEKNGELQSCQKELSSVRNEIKVLKEKLVEAQSKAEHLEVQLRNASREPTDAGDDTQIIHLRNNPLQCAVDAYGEAEKERLRERKAVRRCRKRGYHLRPTIKQIRCTCPYCVSPVGQRTPSASE